MGETMTLEEQGASAREFIAGLIDELGLQADVSTRMVDEETAEVVVDGQELGLLVGREEPPCRRSRSWPGPSSRRRTGGQSSRILVDVAGYRAKRAAALQRFTQPGGRGSAGRGDGARPRAHVGGRPQGRPRHHQRDRGAVDPLRRRGAPAATS